MQRGLEASSAQGTAVAATKKWLMGEHPPITPDRVPTFIQDDAGLRANTVRAPRIDQYLFEDTVSFPDSYFEMLPDVFSIGIKGGVTPVEGTSSQGDWTWTFTPSMTATNSPDSLTLEMGDDTQAYEVEYMMAAAIRINGVIDQERGPSAVAIEVDYFARQLTPTTFTAALSLPTNTPINAKLTQFFQDATFANLGTTEKTGTLRSYNIEILTGLHPKFHGSSDKFFDTHGEGKFEVTADLVLEGNATADAIFDQFQAGTQTFLQFFIDGPQIASGNNNNLTLGIGGYWEAVTPLSENANGNNLHRALLRGTYDPTGANIFALTCTTTSSSI
jgi:hypothetical protein